MSDDFIARALACCAALPVDVVVAVFARWGRPVAEELERVDPASMLELADGSRVGCFAYRAPVDVVANDWFVRTQAGESVAVPGPLFAAAVAKLASSRGLG